MAKSKADNEQATPPLKGLAALLDQSMVAGSPAAIDACLDALALHVGEYQRLRRESGFPTHDSELRTRLFLAMRKAGVTVPNIAIGQEDHMVKPASFVESSGRFAPWLGAQAATVGRPFEEPGQQTEPAE